MAVDRGDTEAWLWTAIIASRLGTQFEFISGSRGAAMRVCICGIRGCQLCRRSLDRQTDRERERQEEDSQQDSGQPLGQTADGRLD